jgi:AraC family transcriptional regulator, transcriptional activator of pobA
METGNKKVIMAKKTLSIIPKISFRNERIDSGFECLSLKELTASVPATDHDPGKPHRIGFFVLLFITGKQVKHQVDFKKHMLSDKDCLLIAQNQVHAFDKKEKYEGTILLFTQDFLLNYLSKATYSKISRLFNYHLYSPVYKTNPEIRSLLHQIIRMDKDKNEEFKTNSLAALLSLLLLQMARINFEKQQLFQGRGLELFDRFKTLVEQEYSHSRNVNHFADKLCVSYKHLNEITKSCMQKTAKEFIDEYLVLEIKRKLCSTGASVKEIAYECGFDEPTNFHKYFLKHTGKTPVQFRSGLNQG